MQSGRIQLKHFFYISNLLSLFRLLVVIPIVLLIKVNTTGGNIVLIILASASIASDYFDGYFSRKLNQVSELGKILDPLADKLAMAAVLIALIIYRSFPLSLLILLLYRDILILAFGTWIAKKERAVFSSNWWGKVNTSVISFAGFLFILNMTGFIFRLFFYAGFATILISGISYYRIGERYLTKTRPLRILSRLLALGVTILVIYLAYLADPAPLAHFPNPLR